MNQILENNILNLDFESDINKFIGSNNANISNWQIAYVARELRHKREITLTCNEGEADLVIEKLNYFSSSKELKKKKINKPNSNQIFLQISI